MKTTVEKKYDSVKEVRRERERIADELKGKSTREIIAYFKEKRRKSSILKNKLQ
jgi:hypothetical protein